MAKRVDLYSTTYGNFRDRVLAEIRREAFGEDIGQNSWITTAEFDTFYSWLNLAPNQHLLEVASGSGGPALYLARKHGCRVTGIDINEEGLNTARQAAQAANLQGVQFQFADLDKGLPFESESFDAIECIDSANHFRDRLGWLKEWHRVLRKGRRILFTDPVVITGPISNDELAARSSIGFFLFVPLEVTERLIGEAGFKLIRREDRTSNMERTSRGRHDARQKHKDELIKIEGAEQFEGIQNFLATVQKVSSERRLSRFVFVAQKE